MSFVREAASTGVRMPAGAGPCIGLSVCAGRFGVSLCTAHTGVIISVCPLKHMHVSLDA